MLMIDLVYTSVPL